MREQALSALELQTELGVIRLKWRQLSYHLEPNPYYEWRLAELKSALDQAVNHAEHLVMDLLRKAREEAFT